MLPPPEPLTEEGRVSLCQWFVDEEIETRDMDIRAAGNKCQFWTSRRVVEGRRVAVRVGMERASMLARAALEGVRLSFIEEESSDRIVCDGLFRKKMDPRIVANL